jgi:hypothetical protein
LRSSFKLDLEILETINYIKRLILISDSRAPATRRMTAEFRFAIPFQYEFSGNLL